ncbi:MAG: hypothetical protein KIG68_09175 [Oxalobacter sp.]|nr:hypothetical protein [Oxalobacter sp.]
MNGRNMAEKIINVSGLEPFGTGAHRKCFPHPDNPDRCIKVIYNPSTSARKEIVRELKYYEVLNHSLKDWSGVPRYYGQVQTDIGTGYVYDLIKNYDGTPAVTLEKMMQECETFEDAQKILGIFRSLKQYLHDNEIQTLPLQSYNILCQKTGTDEYRPVACDNLGERAGIPLSRWFTFLCHRKQERRWKVFMTTPSVKAFLEKFNIDPETVGR